MLPIDSVEVALDQCEALEADQDELVKAKQQRLDLQALNTQLENQIEILNSQISTKDARIALLETRLTEKDAQERNDRQQLNQRLRRETDAKLNWKTGFEQLERANGALVVGTNGVS
ncbi:hypothetical protein BDV95DRAFT_113801 [Massariosphaeria phaeospora]|uniref:Uncharacterized protein n=1 Tax=Massariosphaeria phaeospora TaxID=100035 RepID=A0A7C8M6K8_9PLEO|nr:hypothetical protein BDV95DRAFT_113801 [Massariosphaeria phaeospora]